MPGIVIKPRSRIFHGHEWVYASEIRKTFGDPQPGEVISLKDFKDRPLGSAIYNPKSQIVARRFSRRRQDLDVKFFTKRCQRALGVRERAGIDLAYCRLLWSEADGVPGLVVDRYGDHLVVQTLTLAMDQRRETITEALLEVFQPAGAILERNESPMRIAEGLEKSSGTLHGEIPGPFPVDLAGIPLTADLAEGQKTGLYLDQADNYHAVARHAPGRRVLDCFSNQGGFALAAAQAGASEVTAVDISEGATEILRANAERGDLEIEAVTANVFDFLRSADPESTQFDLIILDPPSFTRNKKSVKEAMRGYKEIHLRALKLLAPGGILATFTCSHHISATDLRQVACAAAVDARKTLREVENYRQRPDHPVLPAIPETEYLKGFAYESIPVW